MPKMIFPDNRFKSPTAMGAFGELSVEAIVAQMDGAVAQLRLAWERLDNSNTTVWLIDPGAINQRMKAIKALIDLLDVGGAARQHVFFPLDGQTQEEAWLAWQDTAEQCRQELNAVGASLGKWTFSSVLAQVGENVSVPTVDFLEKYKAYIIAAAVIAGALVTFPVVMELVGISRTVRKAVSKKRVAGYRRAR